MKKKLIYTIGTLTLTAITAAVAYSKGHTKGFKEGLRSSDSELDEYYNDLIDEDETEEEE